jgi:hypothetical protein
MSTLHTVYPAVIAGYFADGAAAEAALAELNHQIETGPLDSHFERATLFRADAELPAEAQGSNGARWLKELFGQTTPPPAPVAQARSNIVVMVRGPAAQLEQLAEPVLQRHGAYEIKRYGAWDSSAPEERTEASVH